MKYLFIIILCLTFSLLKAQEESNELQKKPAQITFFYPIGLFGMNTPDFEYNFSFNILTGHTGSIDGFEMAGLLNFNDYSVHGVQLAGIGNTTLGHAEAIQIGGVYNIVGEGFRGVQLGSIINMVKEDAEAIQIGGIANYAGGLEGAQLAGILNVSSQGAHGIQMAGIVNASTKIKGGQVAGIANVADEVDGIQIAGIANVVEEVDGIQLAGIANVAQNVTGIQIAGIVNICDSIDGVPIALISIVRKNGYRTFELSNSDISVFSGAFKTGVRKFYTLFTLGYNTDNKDYNYSYGAGVGTSLLLKNKHSSLNFELRSTQITSNFEIYNLLNQYSLSIDYSINLIKKMELFGGVTANFLIADNALSSKHAAPPWAMAFKSNNKLNGWVGYRAGVRF